MREHKGDECQDEHGERVGKPVSNHRTHYLGNRSLLPVGDIAAAPHLAQSGEHQVNGIGAEDAVQHSAERRLDVDGLELQAPAQGPEYVAEDTDHGHGDEPPVVDIGLEGVHHAVDVHILVEEIHEPHANDKGDSVFHEV